LPCNIVTPPPPPPPPPTGLSEDLLGNITLSPNPTYDILNIDISLLNKQFINGSYINIIDLMGKVVHTQILTDPSVDIVNLDVSAYAPGIYVLNFSSNNKIHKIKFLKK
jgi:hypothetical protein